jgi:hypothetical protein
MCSGFWNIFLYQLLLVIEIHISREDGNDPFDSHLHTNSSFCVETSFKTNVFRTHKKCSSYSAQEKTFFFQYELMNGICIVKA